jgi:hypothetical protein
VDVNILTLAQIARDRIFWNTPYRTGNLARNGIADLTTFGANSAGFVLFPNAQTQYGAILNECPTIKYSITNRHTGRTSSGEYVNKHYKWVDNFADTWANELLFYVPGLRRVI